jgi:hypothetical protein
MLACVVTHSFSSGSLCVTSLATHRPSAALWCWTLRARGEAECFATPLNACLPGYCSIFAGDRAFGSLGNFFEVRGDGEVTRTRRVVV